MSRKYKTEGRICVGDRVFTEEFEISNEFYNSHYNFFEGLVKSGNIVAMQEPVAKIEEIVTEEVKVEESKPFKKRK